MAAWSETNGTKVVANIIPTSIQDLYPTHIDKFGRGGYKAVTSLAERDAIPISRLCLGAEVRVTTSDNSVVYYVSKMPDTIVDTMTGKDCEWTEVESGGLDLTALEGIKNQPGGIIGADSEGKVPEQQSRGIVFRGKYIDTTNFQHPNGNSLFPKLENAIYVDNATGHIYTWTNGQFVRDTLYWIEVK